MGLTLIKLKQGDLSSSEFKSEMVDYYEYAALIDRICRLDTSMEITVDCSSVLNLCYTLTEDEIEQIHSAGCPVGHTLISVAPNGDLYPCAALTSDEYRIGNILENDFAKMGCHSPILSSMRNIKNTVSGKCGQCSKIDTCRAGCRGIARSLSNDVLNGDPSCLLVEKQ